MNLTNPIYITGKNEQGKFLLGGAFEMQDEIGFPIDSFYEEANQHGYVVDWLEALCKCQLNDCLKYSSFVKQANQITQTNLHVLFVCTCDAILAEFPKIKQTSNPVKAVCKYILARKQGKFLRQQLRVANLTI